jgi:16S rRNA (guanine(966)-N(2))-methyltransferase RsmD
MRVVAGFLRGRTIKPVPGKNTRPTLDKVKEAVFNILGQFFAGGVGLDLYSGSGNLGIEAISRGLDKCVFVEKSYLAYQTIVNNLKQLAISDYSEVYKIDANLFLKNYHKDKFDYVFLDPPYKNHQINDILVTLVDKNLLNRYATVTVECLKTNELFSSYQDLVMEKEYLYGISKITIYKKTGDNNE